MHNIEQLQPDNSIICEILCTRILFWLKFIAKCHMPLNALWYLIKNKLILQKIQTNMESKESYQISLIWNLHVEWKRKQVLIVKACLQPGLLFSRNYKTTIKQRMSFQTFSPQNEGGEEILLPPQFRIKKKWLVDLYSWILNAYESQGLFSNAFCFEY